MTKLSLTRRSFLKAAAVTGAAVAAGVASQPSRALAEGEDETAGEVQRIRSCCRACGKVECGTWVTVQDNKVMKVEGDESNAHSRGHCCAKSQSSMLALYHPDRLRYCLKRTNPKGEDDPGWVRITLAEAFDYSGAKLNEVVEKYGGQACFAMGGTSRVWAQPPYGTLASIFPTPNKHLAYEICKGPRHFGGILTDEIGSPWMEVEQGPLVYLQWGTAAEYSNYDSTNRTVVDCSQRAYKHILVDPRMTPLGKEADLWLPLRVGTDLAMSCTWLKWILDNEAYDDLFVRRWSNGPFLWNPEEGGRTYKGWYMEMNGGVDLTSRILTEADLDQDWVKENCSWDPDEDGYGYRRFIVWDENNEKLTYWDCERCQWEGEKHKIPTTGVWIEHPYKPIIADAWLPDPSQFADPDDSTYDNYWDEGNDGGKVSNPKGLPKNPALFPGGVKVKLKDGSTIEAGTVWESFAESLEEYTPEWCEEVTEVPADDIVEGVRIYTTRLNPLYGNGGIHYQLAPDQTGHAVQNTRALQLIACITGNSDEPAGNRGSSKAEVDGCCGRAKMTITDHDPQDWGIRSGVGTKELGDTMRDLSIDEQIPLIQDFVQYLIDEDSPLAERYGNHVPSDSEARWIAERKGGDYKSSRAWPGLTTVFDNNENQISAERFPLLRYWNRWSDSAAMWDSINEIDTPYMIHAGVCMSGDFMNESNLLEVWEALTRLDFWLDFNLWYCPNNGCADIIIPCLHWLEVNTGRVSQGAGGIFGAGQRAVEPMGDCTYDPVSVICLHLGMAKACSGKERPLRSDIPDDRYSALVWNDRDLNYDGWNNLDYNDFVQMGGDVTYEEQEYRVLKDATDWWRIEEYEDKENQPEEVIPAFPSASAAEQLDEVLNDVAGPDFPEFAEKFQEEGWFDCRKWHPERWGTYRRWEMGYRRQQGGYNLYAAIDEKCGFLTPCAKVEIWSSIAESYIGDDETPDHLQYSNPDRWAYDRSIPDIDKFPHWFEPKNSKISNPEYYDPELVDDITFDNRYINNNYNGDSLMEDYKEALTEYGSDHTFIMTTGARQPVYFHSEHRQLPWCRELWPSPRFEINPVDAERMGIEQGDWIWIRSPWGAIREVADLYYGIKQGTVNANHAWWYPEFDTASHGMELVNINCLQDKYGQCWICGASQLRGVPVIVYKATTDNCPNGTVVPSIIDADGNVVEAIANANDERLKEWLSNDPRLEDSAVELTFANMDATGLQPSIQSVDIMEGGKLEVGDGSEEELGAYVAGYEWTDTDGENVWTGTLRDAEE